MHVLQVSLFMQEGIQIDGAKFALPQPLSDSQAKPVGTVTHYNTDGECHCARCQEICQMQNRHEVCTSEHETDIGVDCHQQVLRLHSNLRMMTLFCNLTSL